MERNENLWFVTVFAFSTEKPATIQLIVQRTVSGFSQWDGVPRCVTSVSGGISG